MDLDELRYFLNVASAGSFVGGAHKSHVSPPAVSKAIAKLEDTLEVQLFERTTRSVALTPEGEIVLARARRLFEEVAGIHHDLAAASSVVKGDLRIGAMEVFSTLLLPRALAALMSCHPSVKPFTYEMIPQRMEALLLEHRLDVGFTIGAGNAKDLIYHSIGATKAELVCGKAHPLYACGRVKKRDLEKYPFVVPRFLDQEHLPPLDQFPDHTFTRRIGATIELLQMGIQLTIEGNFLGYFPKISVLDHIKNGRLRALNGLGKAPRFELHAITRKMRRQKPAVEAIIAHVRKSARGMV